MRLLNLLPVLPVLLLAACSASDCDPNQAGLITGIGCAIGGGFNTRDDNLKTADEIAQQNADIAKKQDQDAIIANNNAQDKVAQLEAKLQAMNDGLDQDQQQANLDAAHATTQAQMAKIDAVQQEIDALRTQISNAQNQPSQQQVEALKAKHEKEKQDLLSLASQM